MKKEKKHFFKINIFFEITLLLIIIGILIFFQPLIVKYWNELCFSLFILLFILNHWLFNITINLNN